VPKSATKLSQVQEKKLAKKMNGRVQPGSGSQWHSKSDVRASRFLVECKQTKGNSYILKEADVIKAKRAAVKDGREWAMHIEVGMQRVVVVSEHVLLELEEAYQAEQVEDL
jgi:hypothetical protein